MKAYCVILLSLVSSFSFAQQTNKLAIVKKNSKWGAIDVYGKLVIPCEYDFLEITCSELIAAKKEGKFGFIDRANKVRIDFGYDSCSGFYEQKAIVVKNRRHGYINEQNVLVIDYQFDDAQPFSKGLAAVQLGDLWGFANEKGDIVIAPAYHGAFHPFNTQYCLVALEGKTGLINRKGEVVIPFQYDIYTRFVERSEDLIMAYQYPCTYELLRVKDNRYERACNYRFSYLSEYEVDEGNYGECEHSTASNFLEFKIEPYQSDCGIADAESECAGYGMMSKEGKIIFCASDKVKFLDANHFLCYWKFSGMTYTTIDHYQLADSTGKLTDLDDYSNVGDFDNGILTVFSYQEDGKWGGVNWKLETVIPFIYDDIVAIHDSTLVVEQLNKFYITNVKGDFISNVIPYDIYKVKILDHIIVFKSREGERQYGVLDHKGNVLLEPQFDEPIEF